MNAHIPRNLTKLAIAIAAVLTPAAVQANTFNIYVDINVSSLVGITDNAPFFLDFQLNKSDTALATNSVLINGFHFGGVGGGPVGSPTVYAGNTASGSLSSAISISDPGATSPFNEIFQQFSATTTDIGFEVSLTQNGPGSSPDGFLVSVLDSEPNNPPIYTTDGTNSSIVSLAITGANTVGDVATFTSTDPAGVTANVVPEPSSMVALLGGAGCLLGLRRRRAVAA